MAFRIQSNIQSLQAINYLNQSTGALSKSQQRLSSGFRVNSAADDAAGMATMMRFRGEIASLNVGVQNATEASSLLQVAEGAISQVDSILNRRKELATQAASGNASQDLSKIQAENLALEAELGRIVSFTQYGSKTLLDGSYGAVGLSSTAPTEFTAANGVQFIDVSSAKANTSYTITAISATANTMTLSDGTTSQQLSYAGAIGLAMNSTYTLDFSSLGVKVTLNSGFDETAFSTSGTFATGALGSATFQIGDKNAATSQIGFTLGDLSMAKIANGASGVVDLSTQAGAQTALTTLATSTDYVATKRADIGALKNRMEYAMSNLNASIENKTASLSAIGDTDFAKEMSTLTRNQILVQAGVSMLAQANTAPQNVLTLLRG